MGLFNKLFGKPQTNQEVNLNNNQPEHAVIIQFNYGIEGLEALHRLEDQLEEVITATMQENMTDMKSQ